MLGSCYYLSNNYKNYELADKYCKQKGGKIFSPMDPQANEELFMAIQNNALPNHGTQSVNHQVNYYWIDSDPVDCKSKSF